MISNWIADASIRRRFRFDMAEEQDSLSVLLGFNDGSPFAVERFFGRGRPIVQAAPLDFNGLNWQDQFRCHGSRLD